MQSIEAHIEAIKNSWHELWQSEHSREVLNGILDIIKGILDGANEIGVVFSGVIAGSGLALISKLAKGDAKVGKSFSHSKYIQ